MWIALCVVLVAIVVGVRWIRDDRRREKDRLARMAEEDRSREWNRIQQMYRDAWEKAARLPEDERRQEYTRLEEARSKWLRGEELAAEEQRRR